MYLIAFVVFSATLYAEGKSLEEGEICSDNGWTCKLFSECKTVVPDIRHGKIPEFCSFDTETDEKIICCRPDSGIKSQVEEKPKKRISLRKCEEYSEAAYVSKYISAKRKFEKQLDCGMRSEQLIVGGENASLKEFPHQAHIGYGKQLMRVDWGCGGSLISEKWILSAAHCTFTELGQPKWARLGELDYSSDTDGAEPKIVGIKKAINHEGYNGGQYNDIALFELAEILQFTPHIRPLCLQQAGSVFSKFDRAIASGWGRTTHRGHGSKMLLKVELNIVSNENCNLAWSANKGELPNGIISSQMCAGNEGMKDTCRGDSGGPLQRYLETARCMYELIGVTSFGSVCGSLVPGVYTRVSYFVPWIEKIVWPDE